MARTHLLAARAIVDRQMKVVVPLRDKIVELSQQNYDAMLLGIFQLLMAKQNQINAYRDLIEAARDYWVARSELDRATGGRIPAAKTAAMAMPAK